MRKYKNIIRIALLTIVLLLIPFVAMQFSEEVQWYASDFIFMGALIFGTGLAYEFISKKFANFPYRIGVGIALFASFLLIWMNGAVGIIGSENNPANMMYLGVLLIELFGVIVSRLKPHAMSKAMFTTASAQFLVPIIAFIIYRPDFSPGVVGVFMINTFFVLMFAVSGLFFKKALSVV